MTDIKPDSEATQRLLERIQSGDQDAVDGLLARHRPRLEELVAFWLDGRLRARLDPSDVVQETQLDAFRRLDDFLQRRPMPFRLWLRKTFEQRLRMLEREHLEASRRAVGRETGQPGSSCAPLTKLAVASDPTPSQQFARGEMAGRVREAVAQLDEPDREILLMRTFEGLSYAEVSVVIEIDPATARKRHGRALLRLHKFLVDSGVTESQL